MGPARPSDRETIRESQMRARARVAHIGRSFPVYTRGRFIRRRPTTVGCLVGFM